MASTIKVTNINTPDGTGNITVDRPLSGSGASLTNLPAGNLTGAMASGVTGVGKILQVVNTETGAVATGTTIIPGPGDDTIPQNTEGDEYMTLAITPTSASNKLLIHVVTHASSNYAAGTWITSALFQDTTANALACTSNHTDTSTGFDPSSFTHYMTAGTTSSTTFKVRAGAKDSGTTTFNGTDGSRRMGGVLSSSITITEIAV